MTTIITFVLAIAPVLGGWLEENYGWRSNFVFMAFYAFIAGISLSCGFKETNQTPHLTYLKKDYIINHYLKLLKSRCFVITTCSVFLSYGAFFSWFTVGPILFLKQAQMSPKNFGLLSVLGGGFSYALAGYLNGKWVKRVGIDKMLYLGWFLMGCSGIGFILTGILRDCAPLTLIPAMLLLYFGSTFIWPNAFAKAFSPFGEIAGYAAALYGFMQTAGAALIGSLTAFLPTDSSFSLGIVIIFFTCTATVLYALFSD
jgi:DHA1 family bicyclomycin/chloramphenicol resistance-like MFS transporter/DHA1 family 2-module integral membrane pump EmrD-like MFS transporter